MCGADAQEWLTISLASETDTEALGRRIGAHVAPGDVISLEGALGSGKTTLVRGVHAAMGSSGRVRSPSFATLIEYGGTPPLHHFDLFRYERAGHAFLDEFGDWLFGDGVSVIEWAERVDPGVLLPALIVRLETAAIGREAHLCSRAARWVQLFRELEASQ